MKDFTNFRKTEAHNKTIELQNAAKQQTGFIASRLNKDNFWNLVFFAVLAGGTAVAFATKIMLLSWFAIAGSIWIAKSKSSICFDKNKLEFIINNNKRIKASGGELIILMFASFGIIALIGFILDTLEVDNSPLLLATIMSLLVLFPVLYCILRNLPVGIYFKKEAWVGNGNISYSSTSRSGVSSNAFDNSQRTGMNYDYLPNNMWHGSYLDRYYRK